VFTVPEKPVAGEEVMVYFNKMQSEVLRCERGGWAAVCAAFARSGWWWWRGALGWAGPS
jgi:hypothetical protein